ncbi:MAG: HAD hydrolase family protein [Candidatus Omnitrophota bacterium]
MDQVTASAKKIKLLLLDVDGVMTDGRVVCGAGGGELKSFDINDGFGIVLIKRAGLKTAILTAKNSPIVRRRAKDLKIDRVYGDFHYKIRALDSIKKVFKVALDEICFVGDDLVDIPLLKRVGLAVAVPNAVEEVKKCAHFITRKEGGRGAVREVCEFILKSQGKWERVTACYFE